MLSFLDQLNMGSNTILMIGVIVAAVVLAVLGGIVTYRRCRQQADYQTGEDGKTAGPDGISYTWFRTLMNFERIFCCENMLF